MVGAIIGLVAAVASAVGAGVSAAQSKREARQASTQTQQDFHRAQVYARTEGARQQLAAQRADIIAVQREQTALIEQGRQEQRKAILFAGGAAVLGMVIIAAVRK